MLTIALSHDTFSIEVDRKLFMTTFPESMITATLQLDSEECRIELENTVVTPYCLEYLKDILDGKDIGVPTVDLSAAGKYLLIDLLGVVSDPLYGQFKMNLLHRHDTYHEIMSWAIQTKYYRLLTYEFDPDQTMYNLYLGFLAAYADNLPAFKLLLPYVRESPTEYLKLGLVRLRGVLTDHQFTSYETIYINSHQVSVIDVAAIGNANTILEYLINMKTDAVLIRPLLGFISRNDNLRGGELIQPFLYECDYVGSHEMLMRLVLPKDYTYPNLLQAIIVSRHDLATYIVQIPQHLTDDELISVIKSTREYFTPNILGYVFHGIPHDRKHLITQLYPLFQDDPDLEPCFRWHLGEA